MDTQLESEEPERREGLGGRVRRFIDSELNRALDKRDRETGEGGTDRPDTPSRTPQDAPIRTPESDQPAKHPHEDQTGRPAHPVTTPPVEPAYDSAASPAYDSPAQGSAAHGSPAHGLSPHEPDVDNVAAGQVQGRSSTEAAADGSAQRVGLLNDPAGLRDQWQRVQGTFVDDPQRAVHEASVLVDRTLEEIHQNVTRGQTGDPTSTEDLRVSFQRYREFFQRLLSA